MKLSKLFVAALFTTGAVAALSSCSGNGENTEAENDSIQVEDQIEQVDVVAVDGDQAEVVGQETVEEITAQPVEEAKEAAGEAVDKAKTATEKAKEAVGAAADKAKDKAGETVDKAKDKAGAVVDKAKSAAEKAINKF